MRKNDALKSNGGKQGSPRNTSNGARSPVGYKLKCQNMLGREPAQKCRAMKAEGDAVDEKNTLLGILQ